MYQSLIIDAEAENTPSHYSTLHLPNKAITDSILIMKIVVLSALALIAAVAATDCDLKAIHDTLSANTTTAAKLSKYEPKCKSDSGYDIFDISKSFPTKKQADKAQDSASCSELVNIVNSQANAATQCSITIDGTTVTYGHLISNFLDGRMYNESASGSESAGDKSASESSESASSSGSGASDASTTALSFVTYGAIAAIAVALR
ncbi:hypothetical protein V7S43_015378 [Phytophthora oleae]|uniref:Elicitin n=1 Tax=Phytophthora oleae TaxID=2107226 RepID=A0ABD3F3L5_9STRA